MKLKNKIKRLGIIVAAAAVACIGSFGAAGSAFEKDTSPMTKIIVRIKGGRQNKIKVESKIKGIYPDFKTDFDYDTLINGFACRVTENTAKKIKDFPNVTAVEKTTRFTRADTEMDYNEQNPAGNTGLDQYNGEGQAVAVLDTELNKNHEMFKPLVSQNLKLDKQFVTSLTESGVLNARADGRAYLSTKIPFAYSYTNKTDPYNLTLKRISGSHGTHVCGICVGNKTAKASGIAPMAQLVFMGVFEYNEEIQMYVTDDTMVIAALEDAARLNVDAVNLSFGADTETTEDSAYSVACRELISKGTAIFAAAGNNNDRTETSVKNPDHSTIVGPSDINGVMSVASCRSSGISSFSCKGVSQNLEIKPDIAADGENITSAFSEGGYRASSGTSMASPNAAGMFLKLKAKLKAQNPDLSDPKLLQATQNIMMNSAVLFKEKNGLTVSPRSQGAGRISSENINRCNAILTCRGQSKINLYDKLGSTITLPVDVQNLGDEDISFKQAELSVTTDGSRYSQTLDREVFSGIQAIQHSADLSPLKNIGAGQSRSVNITVRLDENQLSRLSKTFTNGFFIEGYIMLSGADKCCDISIPFMGFYGDWGSLPIFPSQVTDTDDLWLTNQPVTEINNDPEPANANSVSGDITRSVYISPNGDGLADNIGMAIANVREITDRQLVIKNSKGELVCKLDSQIAMQRYDTNNIMLADNLTSLKDGEEYTFTISAGINYPNAPKQSVSCKFTVDNTKPRFESIKVTSKNGRKILTVKVKDNKRVDGICIFGKIKGENTKYIPDDDREISRISSLLYPEMKKQGANFFDIRSNSSQSGYFTVSYDITNLSNVNIYAVDGAVNMAKGSIKQGETKQKPKPQNKVKTDKPKVKEKKGSKVHNKEYKGENPATGSSGKFYLTCTACLLVMLTIKKRK